MGDSEQENQPIFDITEGDWHVLATYVRGDVNAHVEFEYKGKPFKAFDYAAYKVWNIPAHLHDITADFELGMALASSFGISASSSNGGDN